MLRAATPTHIRRLAAVLAASLAVAPWCAAGAAQPADASADDAAGASAAGSLVPSELPTCRPDWASKIASMSGHRRAPITSAWLSNGARIHHLKLDTSPGVAVITVSFAGGELRETAANRGVSLAACSAWDQFSVAGLSPGRIPAAMQARNLQIEAVAGLDALQIRLSGGRADLEEGMRIVGALVTRPRVTAGTLSATIAQGLKQLEERRQKADTLVVDTIADVMFPADDPRPRAPSAERLGSITAAEAQAWLDDHLAHAPLEVAIVGDIDLDDALRLAAGFLSDLPARARVSPAALAGLRKITEPRYPLARQIEGAAAEGGAIAVIGFPGADATRPGELRTLRVAARVLDDRATEALRRAGFEGAEVGTAAIPATVYPGFGVVVASFKCPRDRADAATGVMGAALEELARSGATDEELKPAVADLAAAVEKFERQPAYWSGILARCDTMGLDPDEIAEGAAFYRSLDARKVNDAVRAHYADGRVVRLVITGPR